MDDYKVINVGPLSTWGNLGDDSRKGKLFIDSELESEFIGTSVNSTPPGGESPFWHTHDLVEEIYVFLSGVGEIALDDDLLAVEAGTIIRVPKGVWRAVHCPDSASEPLTWLCLRAGGDALKAIGRDGKIDSDRPFPWNA